MSERSDPARGAKPVTKSDTTVLDPDCRALYIGVTGDVAVQVVKDGAAVTFKNVPVGTLPIGVARVMSTNTTASEIVALW